MKNDRPSDREILDVILPVLADAKLEEGVTLTVAGERAVQAIKEQWPGMSLKSAKRAVTRLRIL